MEKEKQEEIEKEDKKSIKIKAKEQKKELKIKKKEEKKVLKLKKKENKEAKKLKAKKEKKKTDKSVIFRKIMAACLVAFTLLGTCYTFIYLVLNG